MKLPLAIIIDTILILIVTILYEKGLCHLTDSGHINVCFNFLEGTPGHYQPSICLPGYVRTYVMYIKQYFYILCGCVIVKFYCNILTEVHVCTAT